MTEVLGKVLPTGFFVIDVKMRPTDGGQTGYVRYDYQWIHEFNI